MRIIGKSRCAAPDVGVLPADNIFKAVHAVTGEAKRRHDVHAEKIGRRGIGRRDGELYARERFPKHLHDAGDYRLVADVVAS